MLRRTCEYERKKPVAGTIKEKLHRVIVVAAICSITASLIFEEIKTVFLVRFIPFNTTQIERVG
jgi:hypothetical protein